MTDGARLIVHADDFGLSEAVNRGIIAAHAHGIVTSASVMATGDAFEHAVALAKAHPSLDVGVHLTLTGERPVAAPATIPTLVDASGRFAPHAFPFAWRYLRGRISLDEVHTELDAQVQRALDSGLRLTHLDGHQHVHVLPGVARVVAALARTYGIRAVRYPHERLRSYVLKDVRNARRVAEQLLLSFVCTLSPLLPLRHTDDFVGFYFGGRLTEANLQTVLAGLPSRSTVELVYHPGLHDPGIPNRSWGYSWAAATQALSSRQIREFLDARRVRLISYRDI